MFKKDELTEKVFTYFFENYISIARLTYLSKIDPFDLMSYLDMLNVEKRVLGVNSWVGSIYRRDQNVDAVIRILAN